MIYLREVEKEDVDLLFKWANDPVVRQNSFNSNDIKYDEHVKWFNNMLEDKDVLQFILMDDNLPVGQIRLSITGTNAEVGYSIASEYRNKGYGHLILQMIKKKVKDDYSYIKKLVAKVKPENLASNRLFEGEGYSLDYLYYSIDVV